MASSTVNAARGSAEGQALGQMIGTAGEMWTEKLAKGVIE